jgi:hypothetical protein
VRIALWHLRKHNKNSSQCGQHHTSCKISATNGVQGSATRHGDLAHLELGRVLAYGSNDRMILQTTIKTRTSECAKYLSGGNGSHNKVGALYRCDEDEAASGNLRQYECKTCERLAVQHCFDGLA